MENKFISEFRQDLVSGDWVLFATERSNRPNWRKKHEIYHQAVAGCPFEDLTESGHESALYSSANVQVVKNKFPALNPGMCGPTYKKGPFSVADAFGFHELVITKDHDKNFFNFSTDETSEILKAYRQRYSDIAKDECGAYIAIFHNFGPTAGGTVFHNHSQIISTPVIPPGVLESVHGSEKYYKNRNERVHEAIISWEIDEGKRIIYENEKFISFCPFVSKTPYEIRIYPKVGYPRFEDISDEEIPFLSDMLNTVIKKVGVILDQPDYNFYIHTAPVAKDPAAHYDFYHWHIEIIPRLTIIGGLELGTDVFVNIVDPDKAAKELRNALPAVGSKI